MSDAAEPEILSLAAADAVVLLRGLLSEGRDARIRVSGSSMRPCLSDGDVVIVRGVSGSEARVGDIILSCGGQGNLRMHRLVLKQRDRNGGRILRTKGDALQSLDAPQRESDVLGRVAAVQRSGGDGFRSIKGVSQRWAAKGRALAGLLRAAQVKAGKALRERRD